MTKSILSATSACVVFAAPLAAQAAGVDLTYLTGSANSIISVVNTVLVPLLIALAFIVFLWGIFKYFIWHGDSETEKADGRKFAGWGIIGFVIIISLWGIVNLVNDTFKLGGQNNPKPPTFTTGTNGG